MLPIFQNMHWKTLSQYFSKNSKPQPSELDQYPDCASLPFLNFMKITVTGDLSHLGRCIDPVATWQRIYSEYTEMSGDIRGLELAKQITFLTNKINITNSIVNFLDLRGNIPELVTELQSMGYRLKFVDLSADLLRVISISKTDMMKLAAAQAAYNKLGEGEKATELNWYRALSALAKHRGVMSINPALISVTEYVAMDSEFREYNEYMKKANG